jgi:membrane protease YdiL (CAAX protease family)
MDPVKAQTLFYIATLTVSGIVFGLILFWSIRTWGPIGKAKKGVEPTPGTIDMIDLLFALTIILFFYGNTAFLFQNSINPSDASAINEVKKMTLSETISNIIIFLLIGAFIFLFASFARGRNPNQVFGINKMSWGKILIWGLGAMVPVYICLGLGSVIIQLIIPSKEKVPEMQEIVQTMISSNDITILIALLFSALIVAPIVEEIIFRGYIYPVLKKYSHRLFAGFMSSLLFAVVHGNVAGLIPLLLLAIILTLCYELTGSIFVPILIHALFNGINSFFILNLPNG